MMRRLLFSYMVGGVIVLVVIAIVRLAHSSGVFPPLGYLASELGVARGQQLPKGVVYNGRAFFFYITSAQEHGDGRYTVEIQAR